MFFCTQELALSAVRGHHIWEPSNEGWFPFSFCCFIVPTKDHKSIGRNVFIWPVRTVRIYICSSSTPSFQPALLFMTNCLVIGVISRFAGSWRCSGVSSHLCKSFRKSNGAVVIPSCTSKCPSPCCTSSTSSSYASPIKIGSSHHFRVASCALFELRSEHWDKGAWEKFPSEGFPGGASSRKGSTCTNLPTMLAESCRRLCTSSSCSPSCSPESARSQGETSSEPSASPSGSSHSSAFLLSLDLLLAWSSCVSFFVSSSSSSA